MPKVFLFEPLMENGNQVVRVPYKGDWYVDPYDEPSLMFLDMREEIKKGTIGADVKYPILTLKVIDSRAIEGLRDVYERFKHLDGVIKDHSGTGDFVDHITGYMWRSISAFIKEVGE